MVPAVLRSLRDELTQRPIFLRALAFLALSCACFYVGKKWATTYEELVVYSSSSPSSDSLQAQPHVTLVTNYHEGSPSQGRPPHVTVSPTGILQSDGSIITKEFPMDEEVGNKDSISFNTAVTDGDWALHQVKKIAVFKACPSSMKEYIPCLDNVDAIKKLSSDQKGEKWERHYPEGEDAYMKCLIPPPAGYQYPIRWPKSRDEPELQGPAPVRHIPHQGIRKNRQLRQGIPQPTLCVLENSPKLRDSAPDQCSSRTPGLCVGTAQGDGVMQLALVIPTRFSVRSEDASLQCENVNLSQVCLLSCSLLLALASACVEKTYGDPFKSSLPVAASVKSEMGSFLNAQQHPISEMAPLDMAEDLLYQLYKRIQAFSAGSPANS